MQPSREFMLKALVSAREGIHKGHGGPFGSCIVSSQGEVLSVAHNCVLSDGDATRHAEIIAISEACRKIGSWDLSGAWLYSTTECCPMCFSAVHWARISHVVFGTSIADVAALGFNELPLPVSEINARAGGKIILYPGHFRDDCVALLNEWQRLTGKTLY